MGELAVIWIGLALSALGIFILLAVDLIWAGVDSRVYYWSEKVGLMFLLAGIVVAVLST